MNSRRWKWLLALLALAILVAVESWAIKKQSDRVCRSAVELAQNAKALQIWLLEAEADSFLGESAMRGPVSSVIAEFRERSRWIQSELGARLLPEQAQQAFFILNAVGSQGAALPRALIGISALQPILHCEASSPLAGGESDLSRRVEGANEFWRNQKANAELAKVEFERDHLIFCKTEELLRGLKLVTLASAERCGQQKLPANLAIACEAEKTGTVMLEITDLEKQKEFNMRKLRQKWPAIVLRSLACS